LNLECAENLPSICACWQPGLILIDAGDPNRNHINYERGYPEREIE